MDLLQLGSGPLSVESFSIVGTAEAGYVLAAVVMVLTHKGNRESPESGIYIWRSTGSGPVRCLARWRLQVPGTRG